jgi:hypothetical protein
MAFEPIQSSVNTLSLNNSSDSNRLNKPLSLADQLSPDKLKKPEDDKKSDDKKEKDHLELSQQAREYLRSLEATQPKPSKPLEVSKTESDALEFRGLKVVAKNRDLTEGETNKLNQIKDNFAQVGIDEKGIVKIADKKLYELQQSAPQLVEQLNSGDVTGEQLAELSKVNELVNKANGFGVSEVEQKQVSTPDVIKAKNAFDSFTTVNKDRKLTEKEVSNLEQLTRQLSSIQGFRINVRSTVGTNGVVV